MTTTTSAPPSERLSFARKLAFGVGDIYGGGAGIVIGFYYLVFLTDVIRISPGLAGTVILLSKIYDSLTDPFEGLIADRTRTRWGRRRPYLLAGVPLVFLSFLTMWYPVTFASEAGRFAFVLLGYVFYSTVVSIVQLSYNALASELTLDYDERTALSSFRIFFSSVASIVAAVLPPTIVQALPDVRQGYVVMALAFGVFFALPLAVTALTARERKEFQHAPSRLDWREAFLGPFQVRTFVYALLMYLLAFVAIDIVQSVVVYFMKNYLGRPGDTQFVSGTLLVVQLLSLPLFVALSRRTGKRAGYMAGAALWMTVMLSSLLIGPDSPTAAPYLFAAAVGLGTGGVVVMIYAIFPDLPDVGELRTGKRQEGTYAALTNLMRKLSSAFSLFLVGNLLQATGYVPPVEQTIGGVTKLIEQPQTPAFLLALRLIFVLAPLVLLSAALFVARRYPLTAELHRRLNRVLAARREGRAETPEEIEDARTLRRLLVDWRA